MIKTPHPKGIVKQEIVFQIILHFIVFISLVYDRHESAIDFRLTAFFVNYALAAFIINYGLLPRYFYPKKYIPFFLCLMVVITFIILVEEFFLEKVFFPDTRGKIFPGLWSTLFSILPSLFIFTGFKFAWDAARKQKEVDELKNVVKESELQFLKSQINPHFLFNNLNNLYAYAIEHSPKTPEIILELSGVLRYMLYECKAEFVPLTKEIAQLQNFIKISELQIEERGTVRFSEKNTQSDYQIAPLILVVFIENAFKHSTASQTEGIQIEVEIVLSETGLLEFVCKNSFQPLSNTTNLSKGIGLENVKKRLNLIYPNAHKLDIRNRDNRYEVRLTMNLNKSTQQ